MRVRLARLRSIDELQMRTGTRAKIFEDYAELYRDGTDLGPLEVVVVADEWFIVDGHHRYRAAQKAGLDEIECIVREGTKQDAVRAALSANAAHGLPRSRADKRRAAEQAIERWPWQSDREIARLIGVSHTFVSNVRAERPPRWQPPQDLLEALAKEHGDQLREWWPPLQDDSIDAGERRAALLGILGAIFVPTRAAAEELASGDFEIHFEPVVRNGRVEFRRFTRSLAPAPKQLKAKWAR